MEKGLHMENTNFPLLHVSHQFPDTPDSSLFRFTHTHFRERASRGTCLWSNAKQSDQSVSALPNYVAAFFLRLCTCVCLSQNSYVERVSVLVSVLHSWYAVVSRSLFPLVSWIVQGINVCLRVTVFFYVWLFYLFEYVYVCVHRTEARLSFFLIEGFIKLVT